MFESKNYPIFKIDSKDFYKYPLLARLEQIPDTPKQMYYRGVFPSMKNNFLSVVGSRNITNYGKDAIDKLIGGLNGQNICIISGLALGADGLAHIAAMKNSLPTIAIPGSGLSDEVIYPKSHKKMYQDILLSGGLLLSEFPPDFPSVPFAFPARNRIMAALSDAVLVVEAAEKSGSLITSRLAIDYNKDVLCVPGQIFSKNSAGTNRLISEGARLVQNSTDILHQFRISYVEKNSENENKEIPIPPNLPETEKNILKLLVESKTKDYLLENLNLETSEFLTALTMLEIKGYISELSGIIKRIK